MSLVSASFDEKTAQLHLVMQLDNPRAPKWDTVDGKRKADPYAMLGSTGSFQKTGVVIPGLGRVSAACNVGIRMSDLDPEAAAALGAPPPKVVPQLGVFAKPLSHSTTMPNGAGAVENPIVVPSGAGALKPLRR